MKYVIAVLVGVIVLLLLFPQKETIIQRDNTKIELLKDSIAALQKTDVQLSKNSDSLRIEKDTLIVTLEKVREIQDTVRIIEIQDSVITIQQEEILVLNSRVDVKDLIIDQKDSLHLEVIAVKDFEIDTLKKQVKKEKRKRIITTIVAGAVLIGVVIASI